jgi:hypothetical protein
MKELKQITQLDKRGISSLVDDITHKVKSGEMCPLKAVASANKMQDFSKKLISMITEDAINDYDKHPEKEVVIDSVCFTTRYGADKIDYKDDLIVQELEKELSDRKELLKLSAHSIKQIYDDNGVEVPKLPISYGKLQLIKSNK